MSWPRARGAVLLAWGVLLVVTARANPNVVYYEPQLDESFSQHIHPYAFAHRYPDPYYDKEHTPSSDAKSFDSFLKLQTHVPAHLVKAKEPSLVEVSEKSGAGDKQKTGFIFGSIKRALSSSSGGNNDPASDKPEPLEGVPSPFQTAIQHDSGVLGNHYRRAVYGLRRRRMPFTGNLMMTHLNPFRRPNSFTNTPQDMIAPRARFEAAVNPKMTDLGSMGGPPGSQHAYTGKSSFGSLPASSYGDLRHQMRGAGMGGMPGMGMGMGGMPGMGMGGMGMGMGGMPPMGSMDVPPSMMMQYPQAFAPGMIPTAENGFHPYAGGSPTFVHGDHTFYDVYTGGVMGKGAEGAEGG